VLSIPKTRIGAENFRHAIYFHPGGLDLYPEALKSAHSKA
jgi:hypothetical protein